MVLTYKQSAAAYQWAVDTIIRSLECICEQDGKEWRRDCPLHGEHNIEWSSEAIFDLWNRRAQGADSGEPIIKSGDMMVGN